VVKVKVKVRVRVMKRKTSNSREETIMKEEEKTVSILQSLLPG